jgi:hypothetical protein
MAFMSSKLTKMTNNKSKYSGVMLKILEQFHRQNYLFSSWYCSARPMEPNLLSPLPISRYSL